ncbi:MAG: hypothetical protein ILO68_05970 [Clostridia bacterium]|nr:hypothetical protein [Clostridia bacterium]
MSKLPEYIRDMWSDAYRLHETLQGMGNTAEDWLKCCELMGETTIRHQEHPLMVALAAAVFEQLERDRRGA